MSEVRRRVRTEQVTYGRVLGEVFRDHREDAGLTQAEMARLCGLPQPTISRVERGVADPQLSTLRVMAEGVEEPLHVLLQLADKRWSAL